MVEDAGSDGITLAGISAELGINGPERNKVSAMLATLTKKGRIAKAGMRRGVHQMVTVFVPVATAPTAPPRPHAAAPGRANRMGRPRGTPLPPDYWPPPVRRAVALLRRRDWAPVVPLDRDTWRVGTLRLSEAEMIEKAERIEARLREGAA